MNQSDPRLGDLIGTPATGKAVVEPSFVLVGCPVDEGVIRNGGRPGASLAPPVIRKYLFNMTPSPQCREAFVKLVGSGLDLGDIPDAGMEEMQQMLAGRIAPWLEKKVPVIVLGGGHETTYGHYLGYRHSKLTHHIINLDAHADVRPLKNGAGHSGSPFRQILDDSEKVCRSYHVMGLQPQSVATDHLLYIEEKNGSFTFRDETDIHKVENRLDGLAAESRGEGRIMMTLDMDVLDQSAAPGVSAPCPEGLPKSLLLNTARLAGKHKFVTSMDLVEVNPRFDRDEQTSRLGALVVWFFLCGLCERSG